MKTHDDAFDALTYSLMMIEYAKSIIEKEQEENIIVDNTVYHKIAESEVYEKVH